jgi:hypothetical protein
MTTSDRPAPRPLRRDAQRNRTAIVAALYRRFPNRAALLDAVLADTVQAHVEVAEQALASDDPWDGLLSTWSKAAGCRPPTAA